MYPVLFKMKDAEVNLTTFSLLNGYYVSHIADFIHLYCLFQPFQYTVTVYTDLLSPQNRRHCEQMEYIMTTGFIQNGNNWVSTLSIKLDDSHYCEWHRLITHIIYMQLSFNILFWGMNYPTFIVMTCCSFYLRFTL